MSCLWHTSLLPISRHGYKSVFNIKRRIRGKALALYHISKSYSSSHPNDRASVSCLHLPSSAFTPPTSILGSSPPSAPNSMKDPSMGTTARDSTNKQEKTHRKIADEILNIVFGLGLGLVALGTVTGIVFYVHERSQRKVQSNYDVTKKAMLTPVRIEPLIYPELCVPEQIAKMRELVFSKDIHLTLIEGAHGSGKTTLVQKLLNERITKDNVPCYYWSLKGEGDRTDFGYMFRSRFGIKEAVAQGIIANYSIESDLLFNIFRSLREEHGAPCVLVVDDAQRLLLNEEGEGLIIALQEGYRMGLLTTIFISSEGSVFSEFRSVLGDRPILGYHSSPSVSDQVFKDYLLGPLNDHLKASGKYKLFDDQLVEWYVSKFGSNFVDMEDFIQDVLKGGTDRETYLSRSIEMYEDTFKAAWKNPDTRIILDKLVKKGSFRNTMSYTTKALEYLIQKNIVAKRAYDYTWNMPLVRAAYQIFTQEHKKP